MSDTVFRSRQDTTQTPPPPLEQTKAGDKMEPVRESTVPIPFSEYEKQNHKPFLVDHYELGTFWDRGDMYDNAYTDEIKTINDYLTHQISNGEINDSVESVQKELKRIEKMVNARDDQRKGVRMTLVAEYTKFILRSEKVKRDYAKYNMT